MSKEETGGEREVGKKDREVKTEGEVWEIINRERGRRGRIEND